MGTRTLSAGLAASLLLLLGGRPFAPAAEPDCPELSPIEDPEAQAFEDAAAAGTPLVDLEGADPLVAEALLGLQGILDARGIGENVEAVSAYRPGAYNDHLAEVRKAFDRLRKLGAGQGTQACPDGMDRAFLSIPEGASPSLQACDVLVGQVNEEICRHSLALTDRGSLAVADPDDPDSEFGSDRRRNAAAHAKGTAVDLRWTPSLDGFIDDYACQVGLHRPDFDGDPVHFELVPPGKRCPGLLDGVFTFTSSGEFTPPGTDCSFPSIGGIELRLVQSGALHKATLIVRTLIYLFDSDDCEVHLVLPLKVRYSGHGSAEGLSFSGILNTRRRHVEPQIDYEGLVSYDGATIDITLTRHSDGFQSHYVLERE